MREHHVKSSCSVIASLAAGLVGTAVLAGPAVAQTPRYEIEQFLAAETFGRLSFSPDARKLLVSSNRSGIPNIYVMPATGGELTPVTRSTKETIQSNGYFPHDERILFSSDQGGNELAHIFVRELDGRVRDVTPGDRHVARFVEWSQDGKSFFVMTNERNPRFFDLYEYATADYSRRLLFTNDQAYQVRAVSPDRRYVGVSRIIDNATTATYVFDTAAQRLIQISLDKPGIASEPTAFSADSSAIFYVSDEGREFKQLLRQDIATGARTVVFSPDWDVSDASLSPDGKHLVVGVNEDARNRPYLFDAATLKPVKLDGLGAGTSAGYMMARNAPVALQMETDGSAPGDIYLRDLRSGARKLLLSSTPPGIPRSDLVVGEVVRFASYDGVKVPGILYVPKDARKGDRRPAVIHVHGGPGDESRIGYRPLVQYLVNHGYVVFEINNRGSSGSGKTFYHMDDRRHGDADLDDVVAAKRMLVETGYVDASRVAIQGQSYGGYMALAGLTFRPREFAAGVDIYGVSNWPRLLRSTPSWWEDLRRLLFTEMGDPEKDADHLARISPVFHAERIVRPLLVLQGANDPRVLPQESEDIVAKIKANGVATRYLLFPDEGHGFRKTANQVLAYRTIKEFLDEHLKAAPAPAPDDPMSLGR